MNDYTWIVAWETKDTQHWEIVDGNDAMQKRVNELIDLHGDNVVVGKIPEIFVQ